MREDWREGGTPRFGRERGRDGSEGRREGPEGRREGGAQAKREWGHPRFTRAPPSLPPTPPHPCPALHPSLPSPPSSLSPPSFPPSLASHPTSLASPSSLRPIPLNPSHPSSRAKPGNRLVQVHNHLYYVLHQSRAGVLWMYLITSTSTFHQECT